MTNASPPPETLRLIDEGDRLQELQAVAAVKLTHNPSTDRWAFSLRPHEDSPPFEPFDRTQVPGRQINETIREGWGVVARAAQLENEEQREPWQRVLEPTIPVSVDYEPGETHWVPAGSATQWESTQAFVCWEIGPTTITRGSRAARLTRVRKEYRLTYPDLHQVVVGRLPVAAASHPPQPAPTELQMNPDVLVTLTDEEKARARTFQTDFIKHLNEVKQGEHLAMLLNVKTAVEAPKGWGVIVSAPIFYYVYTLTETNQKSTFITLLFCSAALWVVKRIAIALYNRSSSFGMKPV